MGERVTISDYDGNKTIYKKKKKKKGQTTWLSLVLPHSSVVIDTKAHQACLLLQRVFSKDKW